MKQLLEIFPKTKTAGVKRLIKQGKINPDKVLKGLKSKDKKERVQTRKQVSRHLGVAPSSLRVRMKPILQEKQQQKAQPPQKAGVGSHVPLMDLFLNAMYNNKLRDFRLLHKLVLLNTQYKKAFQKFLDVIHDHVRVIVTLCHFYDLCRRFPENDFQQLVGVSFILDDPKIGWKSRAEFKIFLENKKFILFRQNYDKDYTTETHEFPDTKNGFIALLDRFIPILKGRVFGINPYWNTLRPLTSFDRQMLKRYHILDVIEKIEPKPSHTAFAVDPEMISHWDMSYLHGYDDTP